MKTLTLELPAMYGDHHVTEVRRLLLEIPGVEDVYASGAFRVAEVKIDEKQVKEDAIKTKLDEAGYLGELPIEVEKPGEKSSVGAEPLNMRHSNMYPQTKQVGFGQQVGYEGRPLWPCPGMGPLQKMDE
jgi:copper chaperone CopZ